MPRRDLAWLLALPLMVAGTIAAHVLAYRIVVPDTHARLDLLARTGHGYLAVAPGLLGACLALLVAALAGLALQAFRGGRPSLPAWPAALLPPLAFAIQEHAERLLANGHFPLSAATEPSFLVGLALQLPFGLAALLLARCLARAAHAVGCALGAVPRVAAPQRARVAIVGVEALLPPTSPVALGHPGRGPPA